METPTYKTFEDEIEDERFSDKSEEDRNARWELVWAVTSVVAYMGLGSLTLCLVWDFHPLTALYFTLQVTTTVGYGDVTGDDSTWQIFMIFYIIVGVAIVANVLDVLFGYILNSYKEHLRKTVNRVMTNLGSESPTEDGVVRQAWRHFMLSALSFLVLVLVWATLFVTLERCTCSFGLSHIEGCVDVTFEQCKETGGTVKTWGSALYFAVVTFSTVGFGDYSPRSKGGRAVSLFLMPLGILAFLSFVGALANLIGVYRREVPKKRQFPMGVLRWVDQDNTGRLDKSKFCVYYLLKEGVVDKKDIEQIDNLFNKLDKRRKGSLSYDARAETIEGFLLTNLHAK